MHHRIRKPGYRWTAGKLAVWLLLVFFAFLFIMPVLFMVITSYYKEVVFIDLSPEVVLH